MSFMIKVGDAAGQEGRLALIRKKYFHNILEYNQISQRERR
jgi:hypothetical protein